MTNNATPDGSRSTIFSDGPTTPPVAARGEPPTVAPSPAPVRVAAQPPVPVARDVQTVATVPAKLWLDADGSSRPGGVVSWVRKTDRVWQQRSQGVVQHIALVGRATDERRSGTVFAPEAAGRPQYFLPDNGSGTTAVEVRDGPGQQWRYFSVPVIFEWATIDVSDVPPVVMPAWAGPAIAAPAVVAPGVAAAAGLAAPAPAKPVRKPLPGLSAQLAAERTIRGIFARDYASPSNDQILSLAKRLMAEVGEAKDEATRYVLLREATDLAVRAGDFPLASEAIGRSAGTYDVDGFALRVAALTEVARRASGPATAEAVARQAGGLVGEAIDRDDYPTAVHLVGTAKRVAEAAGGRPATEVVAALARRVSREGGEFARVRPMLKMLESAPGDAKLNLVAGTYYALHKGQWDRGLPMLARGDDARLQILARADRSAPTRAAEQEKLGDGWSAAAAGSSDDRNAARGRERAGYWYRRAEAHLRGLDRARVEKKREAVERQLAGRPAQ